jgi:hypothetical protein
MSPETLALGRNLALIVLALEAILLALPLLIVPFYAIRYIRRARAPIRPVLRRVRWRARQVEDATKLASSMAAQPFLWARSAGDGITRGLGYLMRWR